jgi:hypothetical protein
MPFGKCSSAAVYSRLGMGTSSGLAKPGV